MKNRFLFLIIFLLISIISLAGCEFGSLEGPSNEEKRKPSIREGEFVAEIAEDTNNVEEASVLSTQDTYLKVVEYAGKTREEVKEILIEEGYDVKSVFPNLEFNVMKQEKVNLLREDLSWNLDMINLPEAYNHFSEELEGQNEVKIAVLDTGIDPRHESLENFVDESLTANFTGDEPEDVHGHGTHVAGIIAAHSELTGVMDKATLVNVKVLNDSGMGTYDGILSGIEYAAEIGADVINMSLGGYIPSNEEEAIRIYNEVLEYALDQGTLPVAAAGNNSLTIASGRGGMFPAASPHSLAIGASNKEKKVASYSNYGDGLHVVAPGSSIYSAVPGDDYVQMSGTSMAAPHAAGQAGLLRAVDDELSAYEKFEIIEGAGNEDIFSVEYEERYIGSGHMDVYRTINHYYIGDYLPE